MFLIRKIGRLYIIQLGAWLSIWLASYFPGLDILMALLFMVLIMAEIHVNKPGRVFLTALLWQLPGIILVLFLITGLYDSMPGGEYYIFVLELWYTPVIPLITLLSAPFLPHPVYYNILLLTPFMLMGYYILGNLAGFRLIQPSKFWYNKTIR